jgi:hypothetical protein
MITNCHAEIKRLVYQDNVARGKQTITTYSWYLTTVNENSQLMTDGKFWKLYKLSIQCLTEIRESDSVVIDWVEFTVKWVAYRHWWHLSLTTVILEKWV